MDFNQTTVFSNGFQNLPAPEAAGADPNSLGLTIDQCPDRLQVGFEGPFGFVIGVTDVMARLASFAAKVACECQCDTPCLLELIRIVRV